MAEVRADYGQHGERPHLLAAQDRLAQGEQVLRLAVPEAHLAQTGGDRHGDDRAEEPAQDQASTVVAATGPAVEAADQQAQ